MSQAWHPFYWADYLADTGHLTLAQHGAYLLLMGHYYRSGKPIPANAEQLQRVCRANAPAERAAVAWVLENLFQFDKTENVYHHKRIDQELSKTADISQKRRAAALQKHSKSSANASDLHTQSQSQSQSQENRGRKVPPPVQSDFDERDIRLIARAEEEMRLKFQGQGVSDEEWISEVCRRVGITAKRFHKLSEIQRVGATA